MKKNNVYYSFIPKVSSSAGIVIIIDKQMPVLRIGEDISMWRTTPEFELRNGEYSDYHMGSNGVILISKAFMSVLEDFMPNDYPVEFLPALVRSEKYGDRLYYIIYYKKVFGVVDKKLSKYTDNAITVTAYLYEKVKDLPFFPDEGLTLPAKLCGSLVVNDEVYKALKKHKMLCGLEIYKQYAY